MRTYEFKFYAQMEQLDPLSLDEGVRLTKDIGSAIIDALGKESVTINDMQILELKE